MNQSSIIVKNVSAKWQGQAILHGISFTLQPNEHLLITGDSGSGKTMLAKAMAGKLFHNGDIRFLLEGKDTQPSILLVEQHYHFKNLSNVNSFYYQQRFNSFDADDARSVQQELECITINGQRSTIQQITGLLQKFDLAHRAASPLLHLSSGEHKRFQLVKALLQSPDVMILDEPFTGLDVQTRCRLQEILNALAAAGTRILLICDPHDAPECITHFAKLVNGALKLFVTKENYPVEAVDDHQQQFNLRLPAQAINVNFTSIVKFNNVSVSYGSKRILNNINWQVKPGEKWLLKGKNGAGKSTLLSLVTGDNPQAYANDIYLFGKRRGTGESIWDIKKNIGYVSPELQWYFDTGISCYQAVASGFFDTIGLFRVLNHTQEKEVSAWLNYFDLTGNAMQLLSALPASKQRLALLARAMVKNPAVLILDEPCQGLDQHQKNKFIQLTDSICTNTKRTLIYVTHYQEDVPNCINEVLELEEGNGRVYRYR